MRVDRFGPWFIEPVIAGLTADNQPFLSSMDCLGCEMKTKDFVVAGTMEEALYGMCESMYRPDMVSAFLPQRPIDLVVNVNHLNAGK